MATTTHPVAPLESGDHLTREEFHRRYLARPDIKKAELVEGVVYVASPVGSLHSKQHGVVVTWLGTYTIKTRGVQLRVDGTLLLSGESEIQPDVFLFRESPPAGAGAHETEDGFVAGVPELIVEIAASSASYDLHSKLRLYEAAGVPEYIVWQVYEHRIDWFRLRDGAYVRVEPDQHGVIESAVFPGLRLNVPKMLAGDNAGVVAELQDPRADPPE